MAINWNNSQPQASGINWGQPNTQNSLNLVATPQKSPLESIWENLAKAPAAVGNFVTSGTGQDIAAAIGGGAAVEQAQKLSSQQATSEQAFLQMVNAHKQANIPLTSAQQSLFNEITSRTSPKTSALDQAAQQFPSLSKSNEQVAGDFAGLAADIVGAGTLPGATEGIGGASGVLQGIKQGAIAGAKSGAVIGGTQGLAGGLKDNQDLAGVTGSTLFGALTGAIGGAAIGGVTGGFTASPKMKTNYDTAIKDVTPSYSQATPTGKDKLLPRTQEGGFFSGRQVVSNQSEENSAAALASMDNYNPSATALQKSQAVTEEIAKEADATRSALANSGVIVPKKEMLSVVSSSLNDVAEGSLSLQRTDPVIEKYVNVAQNALKDVNGTAEGILDFRQSLDNAYNNARGNLGFNPDKVSALDEVHQAARSAINKLLIDNAPNVDVKLSFQYQNALYNAKDQLEAKAVKEAGSKVGRMLQSLDGHPFLKKAALGAASALGFTTVAGGGYEVAKALGE